MKPTQFLLGILMVLGVVLSSFAEEGDREFDRGYDAFVSRDYKEAASWWRKAADKGHARAQNGLGVLYRDGDLGGKDDKQAANCFRQSAENGYAFGMFNLAMMYRDGAGVERDDVEAHKWFNLATTVNFDLKARFQRDLIARRMSQTQITEAQRRAQDWLNSFFFGGQAPRAE